MPSSCRGKGRADDPLELAARRETRLNPLILDLPKGFGNDWAFRKAARDQSSAGYRKPGYRPGGYVFRLGGLSAEQEAIHCAGGSQAVGERLRRRISIRGGRACQSLACLVRQLEPDCDLARD